MYYYVNILNVIHCQFMSAFFFENFTYCLHGPRRKVTELTSRGQPWTWISERSEMAALAEHGESDGT